MVLKHGSTLRQKARGKMSEVAVFLIGWCIFCACCMWICIKDDKKRLKVEEEWLKEEIERYGGDE